MKKLFSLLALLIQAGFCLVSTAQTIRFTDPTNRWNVRTTIYPNDLPVTSYETFKTDDIPYEWNGNFYSVIRGEQGQTLYVREDTDIHKVYLAPVTSNIGLYVATETTTEFVYMDFSLAAGDTFSFPIRNNFIEEQDSLSKYFVASVDSVQLGVKWYKQMRMQRVSGIGYSDHDSYTITEGIGFGLMGGFWVGPTILTYFTGEWKPQLVCFSNGDSIPYPPYFYDCFGPVGIKEHQEDDPKFSLYPNPANGYINVTISSCEKNTSLDIVDLTGRIVLTRQLNTTSSDVEVSKLGKGMYVVDLRRNNSIIARKKLVVR